VHLPSTTPAESGDALLVRVHGDAEVARRKLDAEIAAINPGAIDQIHRMDEMRCGRRLPVPGGLVGLAPA